MSKNNETPDIEQTTAGQTVEETMTGAVKYTHRDLTEDCPLS